MHGLIVWAQHWRQKISKEEYLLFLDSAGILPLIFLQLGFYPQCLMLSFTLHSFLKTLSSSVFIYLLLIELGSCTFVLWRQGGDISSRNFLKTFILQNQWKIVAVVLLTTLIIFPVSLHSHWENDMNRFVYFLHLQHYLFITGECQASHF